MAHGFLAYEPVSGESPLVNFAKKKLKEGLKSLWGKFQKTSGSLVKSSGGQVQYDANPQGVTVKDVTRPEPPARRMLSGSTAAALGSGIGSITRQEPTAVPGGTGGGIAKKPGGSFTELPGVAAASGGLNAETFFKQATTGVGASGEYLTNAQRREAFIKSRQESVKTNTSASAPPISPDSGVDIVAAVNRNTQMIVSLVEAVKAQTKNDSNLVEKQIQGQETLMLRAAARDEEAQLEQGGDYSGFMTPENFEKRKKQEKKKEEGSKLKEFFRGPNPFKKDEGCGCSPFMPGPGGRGPILGGPQGGGGLPIPDYVDEYRDMNRRRGSRLGGGASVTRRAGGARRATRLATKIGGKGLGKAVGKGLAKKIPGVGVLAGGAFAAERAMKGDWMGAGGELLSGVASLIPGLGTAVSTGIDAGLAARDAGLTPFANGGIVTSPVAGLVGEAGNEGIFPLEGKRGEKTFRMFGEGVFQAQKDNDKDFAKLQSMGLKQYYEREGGFKKMAAGLKDFFAGLGGAFKSIFDSLTGGRANAGTLDQAGDYLSSSTPGARTAGEAGLLKALRFAEGTEKSYGTIFGGNVVKELEQGELTVQEVINMADTGKLPQRLGGGAVPGYGKGSKATGAYQFMPPTLEQLIKDGVLKPNEKFTNEVQDKAALALAKKRGVTSQMLDTEGFSQRVSSLLAPEWASLPTASGKSYYGQPVKSLSSLQAKFKSGKEGFAAEMASAGTSGAGGLTKGAGTFIQGNTGASRGDHFHFGPDEYRLEGKKTPKGLKDAREAAFKAAKGLMAKGIPFYFSNYSGLSKPWFKGKGDKKTDEELRNAILAEQNAHAARAGGGSWGGIDIATAHGTKLPVGVGPVKDKGDGFGNAATITGTRGFVGHGASGSRATKADELVSVSPPPAPEGSAMSPLFQRPAANKPAAAGVTPSPIFNMSAANANTGTPMMATSQQVAMASMGSGAAPTVINNYYTSAGGSGGGVNPNGVSPGIGMEQTGTAVFQDLRIRALA